MQIQEGKSGLFQGFNIMCETICSLTPTGRKFTYQELLFGWAYSTICWNTMGRSHSVAGIMFHHITWKDDCLVITFPKSKCDQTGEGLSNDKHVYANPYKPAVCPILALAVMVFCTYRADGSEQHKLFGGNGPVNRFIKILKKIRCYSKRKKFRRSKVWCFPP